MPPQQRWASKSGRDGGLPAVGQQPPASPSTQQSGQEASDPCKNTGAANLPLLAQGVLSSAAEQWPHIHISDSLVMADRAVAMAEAGCK